MAARRITIRVTVNFEANLDAIEAFLIKARSGRAFNALIDDLTEHVIPALESHPDIGQPFLARPVYSVEVRQRLKLLQRQLGSGILREYLAGDYLILYAVRNTIVDLLAIKHHRQLSFNLSAYWRSR